MRARRASQSAISPRRVLAGLVAWNGAFSLIVAQESAEAHVWRAIATTSVSLLFALIGLWLQRLRNGPTQWPSVLGGAPDPLDLGFLGTCVAIGVPFGSGVHLGTENLGIGVVAAVLMAGAALTLGLRAWRRTLKSDGGMPRTTGP